MGLIALLVSSVHSRELSLAGKVSFTATLESLALLGNEMAPTWGILECDTSELENDGVIALKGVRTAICILPGLVFNQ